jgi:hypothetical protein
MHLWLWLTVPLAVYLLAAYRAEIGRQGIVTYPKTSASFAGAYAAYGRYQSQLLCLAFCNILLILLHPVAAYRTYFALAGLVWILTWWNDFYWENSSLEKVFRVVRLPMPFKS